MLIATQRLSFISADGLQNCSLKSKGTSTGGSSAAAAVRRSGSKQICPRKAASSSSSGECSATGSMLSADSRGGEPSAYRQCSLPDRSKHGFGSRQELE